MKTHQRQPCLDVKSVRAILRITVTVLLAISGMAARAGAQPPSPPPGCGFFCGTMTLIKDPSVGIPFADPERALSPPWVSYQLGLHLPELPNSQTVGFEVVIEGQLHQRWSDSNGDGVVEPTANDLNASAGDSHLMASSDAQFGIAPIEDNSGNGSPLADTPTTDYGVGTRLHGAWSYLNASRYTNLAYLVFPKGSPTEITVVWSSPGGPQQTLTTRDLIWIPEPSSASLAILAFSGCLLALPLRRKP